MRRSYLRGLCLSVIACMAVCAAAIVHAVERAIDWGLNILRPMAPTFNFGGELAPAGSESWFADPHVERHEAGTSRRAAARGI